MSARRRTVRRTKPKPVDGHEDFLRRITKTLYYGKLPAISSLSLPVMELSTDLFSESQKGKSLKRLYLEDATELTRNACVSPCSLVLALVYLDRLKTCNPKYVAEMAPTDLFLVSLMVSNKFLQDASEEDEVISKEWAASAGITPAALNQIEKEFLHAIDWRVYVSDSQFDTTLEWLEQQISLRQAKQRGWFSYTDLMSINNNIDNIGLIKCLATVYAALSVSYLASVYSIVASSLIVSQSLVALSTSSIIVNSCDSIIGKLHCESSNASRLVGEPAKEPTLNYDPHLLASIERLGVLDQSDETHKMSSTRNETYPPKPLYLTFLREIFHMSFLSRRNHDPMYDTVGGNANLRDPVADWTWGRNCADGDGFPQQIRHWSSVAVC